MTTTSTCPIENNVMGKKICFSMGLVVKGVYEVLRTEYKRYISSASCIMTFSVRWKILLDFKCRNRLLLTGTPIQNTMQEVRRHYIQHVLVQNDR